MAQLPSQRRVVLVSFLVNLLDIGTNLVVAALTGSAVIFAEMARGLGRLSGAWEYADAQLCPDDDDFLDREQGIPHLKGIPCRINKLGEPRAESGS